MADSTAAAYAELSNEQLEELFSTMPPDAQTALRALLDQRTALQDEVASLAKRGSKKGTGIVESHVKAAAVFNQDAELVAAFTKAVDEATSDDGTTTLTPAIVALGMKAYSLQRRVDKEAKEAATVAGAEAGTDGETKVPAKKGRGAAAAAAAAGDDDEE